MLIKDHETHSPPHTGSPHVRANLRVGIFSLVAAHEHGGLESYIRMLTQELQNNSCSVSWNGAPPHAEVRLRDDWSPRVKRLLPIMTRPSVRFLSRSAAQWQGAAWCEKAIRGCDVVHFVGTGWDLVGFPLVRAARNQNKIITCWPAVHPKMWGDAALDIDLYRQMNAVFVQSDYEGKHLEQLGVDSPKLVRCGCAAPDNYPGDADRFRTQHGVGDRKLVLFIGRKSRGKGYHSLRMAIDSLQRGGCPVTLVSIGRDFEPPYPSLPDSIDLDLDAADDTIKHDALAACDVFALPSEAESFGIVYVEAWAYGKPVVCGAAPASQELVKRHGGGITTDGSPSEVTAAIERLLTNSKQADALGRAGLNAVCAEYTAEQVFIRHHKIWMRTDTPTQTSIPARI